MINLVCIMMMLRLRFNATILSFNGTTRFLELTPRANTVALYLAQFQRRTGKDSRFSLLYLSTVLEF